MSRRRDALRSVCVYFSLLKVDCVRVEITYGEENTSPSGQRYAGARKVMATLSPDDVVVVVDVTGYESGCNIVIEKFPNDEHMLALVIGALGPPQRVDGVGQTSRFRSLKDWGSGGARQKRSHGTASSEGCSKPAFCNLYSYEIFHDVRDPVAQADEVDAYREVTSYCFFLGLCTRGGRCGGCTSDGDYNSGCVFLRKIDLDACSAAIGSLSHSFSSWRQNRGAKG